MAMATGSICGCCNMNTLSTQQESEADEDQHNGKYLLQQAAIQLVRQLCAETGKKDTGGHNTDQRRQIDKPNTEIGQLRVLPAGPDVASCAGQGNRQAAGRGRGDSLLHAYVTPGEVRH